ncbi:MAG TPA: serine/threonine-protein kinase, partial [Polyangiaceae bacterium]|nr:serine/threonine-protein kinase [Polyangiaceae bacterium]
MMRASPSRVAELDRYELLGKLGEGGFGAVYEARDRSNGERVALKELTAVNAVTLGRFKQEFRAVQEVTHPNLVRLDALFEERGKWLIAMELVEGQDLLDYLYSEDHELGFHEPQLRETFRQLAEGLAALHAAGVVHRDLKPRNVRVTPAGRVVLLDFGLATAFAAPEQTDAGGLGTLAYMAPEQASGAVGPSADWYAFGVCLYEALSGVLPIDAADPRALLSAKQR